MPTFLTGDWAAQEKGSEFESLGWMEVTLGLQSAFYFGFILLPSQRKAPLFCLFNITDVEKLLSVNEIELFGCGIFRDEYLMVCETQFKHSREPRTSTFDKDKVS